MKSNSSNTFALEAVFEKTRTICTKTRQTGFQAPTTWLFSKMMSNEVFSRKISLSETLEQGQKEVTEKGRISNKSDLRWCNRFCGKISKWQFDRNSDRRHRISCQNGDKGVVWLAWQKFTCWSINTLWFHVIFSVNAKCHWNQLSTVLFWFCYKIIKLIL